MVLARDLKIGVLIPGTLPAGGALAYARLIEASGLDSAWLGDHVYFDLYGDLLAQGNRLADAMRGAYYRGQESLTILAALAVATERVELGPLVACTGYRNPALLADIAETIDDLSGGRLILGLGAGNMASEHRIHGFPFDRRIGRFEEALQIIRPMLRGEAVTFVGEFYRTEAAEVGIKGPRAGGPPIMIGALGGGPRMQRLVAQHADIWNAWVAFGDSAAAAYGPLRAAMDAACERYGRDPATLACNVTVDVALPGHGTLVPTARPLTGSSAEIAAGLAAYADHGVGHLSVVLTPNTAEAIEALARARAAAGLTRGPLGDRDDDGEFPGFATEKGCAEMALRIARLINLILAGMLTGNEFASLVAVYPALAQLPPLAGLRAEQAIYRRYGRVMPPYMQAMIASFLPVLALQRDRTAPAFRLTLAGSACFAAMLAVTATQNLPINSRIVELPAEEASVAEFRALRARWDRLHIARNLLNVTGLALTCLGALSSDRSGSRGRV